MTDCVLIALTRNKVAIIDADDAELVGRYWWHAAFRRDTRCYAQTHLGDGRYLFMHRLIVPTSGPIDHADGDGLNNLRENLRPCTNSQNLANLWNRSNTSGYKGVSWCKHTERWRAQIKCTGQPNRSIGRFDTKEAAAHAYDEAAKELFGEFAWLNFPDLLDDKKETE